MAYVWFNLVLEALGKRLNYESISNLDDNTERNSNSENKSNKKKDIRYKTIS